jgi:hypothetical protein
MGVQGLAPGLPVMVLLLVTASLLHPRGGSAVAGAAECLNWPRCAGGRR